MSFNVVVSRTFAMKFCTECNELCHLYEQGLCCNCGNPWETEVIHEENYPKHWVDADVVVKYKHPPLCYLESP